MVSREDVLNIPSLTGEESTDPVERAYNSFPSDSPLQAGVSTTAESFPQQITKPAKEIFRTMSLATNRGYESTVESYDMLSAMDGTQDWESVAAKYEPGRLQQLRDQEIDLIEANWEKDYGPLVKFGMQVPRVAAESIPFMGAVMAGGAATGAGTSAVAAGAAALTGPLAPITVPAAAAAAYPLGFMAGSTSVAAHLSMGAQYNNLRKLGHSHDNAVPIAAGAGIIEGLIYNLKLKQLGDVGSKAFEQVLLNPATKRVAANMAKSFIPQTLMGGLKMSGLSGLAELDHVVSEWVADMAAKGPAHVPSAAELEEAVKTFGAKIAESTGRLGTAAVTGFQAGVGLTGGIRAASYLGAGTTRVAGKLPGLANVVDGVINEVYLNRQLKRQKLKGEQVEKGLRKEPKWSQATPAQLQQIKQNFQQLNQMRIQDRQNQVQHVTDALAEGAALADLPPVVKQSADFVRTGMIQGFIPVAGDKGFSMVGGTTNTAPWTAMRNTLTQFVDKGHLANEVLDITDVELSYKQNKSTFQRTFMEMVTADADPYLVDAVAQSRAHSALAKTVLNEYNQSLKGAVTTAGQTKTINANRRALQAIDDVRIELYGHMQDPTARRGLVSAGYTFSGKNNSMELIKRSLSAEQLEMLKNGKAFLQKYYPRINEGYVIETGEDLPNNPDFSGYLHRGSEHVDLDAAPFLVAQEHFTRSLKERTNNDKPVELGNGFIAGNMQYINMMEHYFAYKDKAVVLNAALKKRENKLNIEAKLGKDFYKSLMRMKDHQIGVSQPIVTKGLTDLISNVGSLVMTGNVVQFPKQLVSGLAAYSRYVPLPHLLKSYTETALTGQWNDRVKAFVKDSKSKYIRRDGFNPELAKALELKDPTELLNLDKEMTFRELMAQPTKLADDIHTTMGGYAIYDFMRSQGKPHAEAVLLTDRIIEEHQSSTLKSQKSLAELESTKGAAFTLLSTQGRQVNHILRNDVARVIANPTMENLGQVVKTWAAFKAAQISFRQIAAATAITTALTLGTNKDVEETIYMAASRGIRDLIWDTQMPFFGQLSEAILGNASNWTKQFISQDGKQGNEFAYEPSTPAIDVAAACIQLSSKALDLIDMEPNEDAAADLVDFALAYNRSIAFLTPKWLGGGYNLNPMLIFLKKAMEKKK